MAGQDHRWFAFVLLVIINDGAVDVVHCYIATAAVPLHRQLFVPSRWYPDSDFD